jgi:hypothetical protein
MLTLKQLLDLRNGDGLTLKKYNAISYKSGWQVATEGVETRDAMQALHAVEQYAGTCGIWYANGIYYVDKSHREDTKKDALAVGRAHSQISIYGWKTGKLAYC